MRELAPAAVYLLCFATSAVCAGLVTRGWLRTRTKLLLWTAVSFAFLTVNNLLLVADMVILPHIDLWPYRQAANVAALGVLLYGFIWEVE